MGRNTGPALAVGALLAVESDPQALILSAHADHSIPDPAAFHSARHFAAWLGLTPTDHSTAGKHRLGVAR